MKDLSLLRFILLTSILVGCEGLIPEAPSENELLDGPMQGLNAQEQRQFLEGDIAFNDEVFSAATGLGPFFVAPSCGSCHIGDGKGHPFTTLTRFGQSDTTGNTYLGKGGPQLQNKAIPGFTPETLPPSAPFSKFTPPAVTGLGLLEALTDAQILSNADPDDLDGDGISGRPNWITPPSFFIPFWYHETVGGRYIGRFGKKSAAINLLHQTVGAYAEDMGVTSDFIGEEPSIYNRPLQSGDNVPDPEVPASTVQNVVFYLRTLKAPLPRNTDNEGVVRGKSVFTNLNCDKCHTPQWTSPVSDIATLSEKTFFPYTDLLLHDMGPALNDGYTEGNALPEEWRTPPLWGLGLSKQSQGGKVFLMHDGRARSIDEAIRLHGGEAAISKNMYESLDDRDRSELLFFLNSL